MIPKKYLILDIGLRKYWFSIELKWVILNAILAGVFIFKAYLLAYFVVNVRIC